MCNDEIIRCQKSKYSIKGFTLMEMTLVIVILSIMAVGISGFITLSTNTYLNATNRDELIGNARFVIERLNRELRNAVPNSIRVRDVGGGRIQCLQFTPIVASTAYTDIPVQPEPASKILSIIPFNDENGNPYSCGDASICKDLVTVYPLEPDTDIYSNHSLTNEGKIFRVNNVDRSVSPWQLNIQKAQGIHFKEDSPTSRLYITNEQVSYCAHLGFIFRYSDPITSGVQPIIGSERVYMAGYLINDIRDHAPFTIQPATLKRNAVVQIHLNFTKNDESYVFDHDIHLNNVP